MFFIPGLVTPGPDWPRRATILGFGFLTGPALAFPLSRGKDYMFEWPATWCAYSIGQVALVTAMEAWAAARGGEAAGKAGGRVTRRGGKRR
jgi:hypothetical protein